jgi:predicted amino acid dehydrogenase
MLLDDRSAAARQVMRAARYARKLGASHVGLGAMTSVVTDGGNALIGTLPGVVFTNGNAFTAAATIENIQQRVSSLAETRGVRTAAIVGATGSIGSAIADYMAGSREYERLYIVGKTPAHIDALLASLAEGNYGIPIKSVDVTTALREADIVVVATSSSNVLIEPSLFKHGAVVLDITQPSNLPKDLQKLRPDLVLVTAGLVQLPNGAVVRGIPGLPRGKAFACLAETILFSLENYKEHSVGKVGRAMIDKVTASALRCGFDVVT